MSQSSEQLRAVGRMQEYIEQHLKEPMTLNDLSRAAGYSAYYCVRIFREYLGRAPFDYIRALRLSRAALTLRDGGRRVLDVAMDYAFESHEGFTRAFRREFGLTPSGYSKAPPPIPLFIPYPVEDEAIPRIPGRYSANYLTAVATQEIARPRRKLLLRRAREAEDYFSYCEEVGCDYWGMLCSVKEALFEPMGLWLPDSLRPPETSRYVQGVEVPVDYSGTVPPGFDMVELPPCRMLLFQGDPFEDECYFEAVDQLRQWIEAYDPSHRGLVWADNEAPRFQLEPLGSRGYIEARAVREL